MAGPYPWEVGRSTDEPRRTQSFTTKDVANIEALSPFSSDEALETFLAPRIARISMTARAWLQAFGVVDLANATIIGVFDPPVARHSVAAVLRDHIAVIHLDRAARIWADGAHIGGIGVWPPVRCVWPDATVWEGRQTVRRAVGFATVTPLSRVVAGRGA